MPKQTRPDMRAYFAGRIDHHVNGMMARTVPVPRGVKHVSGDVTDSRITVVTNDGVRHLYDGGQYASRKVNGCYAPKQPTYAGVCDGLPLDQTTCPDRAGHM